MRLAGGRPAGKVQHASFKVVQEQENRYYSTGTDSSAEGQLMMKKHEVMMLLLIAGVVQVSGREAVAYSGGAGTAADPYHVTTVDDWIFFSETDTDWDKHFVLKGDINFNSEPLGMVGSFDKPFIGVFDGDGHVLRNVRVKQQEADYVGLFSRLNREGKILNLEMEGVDVIGKDYVGGLVGFSSGTIRSCHIKGTVTGNDTVGGLVGSNYYGFITLCSAIGTVSGGNNVGGLVGDNWHAINSCYSAGKTLGFDCVGGLVGNSTHSWAYGSDNRIGMSYASNTVIGDSNVGGLVGSQFKIELIDCESYIRESIIAISSCYANGTGYGSRKGRRISGDGF